MRTSVPERCPFVLRCSAAAVRCIRRSASVRPSPRPRLPRQFRLPQPRRRRCNLRQFNPRLRPRRLRLPRRPQPVRSKRRRLPRHRGPPARGRFPLRALRAVRYRRPRALFHLRRRAPVRFSRDRVNPSPARLVAPVSPAPPVPRPGPVCPSLRHRVRRVRDRHNRARKVPDRRSSSVRPSRHIRIRRVASSKAIARSPVSPLPGLSFRRAPISSPNWRSSSARPCPARLPRPAPARPCVLRRRGLDNLFIRDRRRGPVSRLPSAPSDVPVCPPDPASAPVWVRARCTPPRVAG
jgi:hypothetical protein